MIRKHLHVKRRWLYNLHFTDHDEYIKLPISSLLVKKSSLCQEHSRSIKSLMLPTDDEIDKMDNASIYLAYEE